MSNMRGDVNKSFTNNNMVGGVILNEQIIISELLKKQSQKRVKHKPYQTNINSPAPEISSIVSNYEKNMVC